MKLNKISLAVFAALGLFAVNNAYASPEAVKSSLQYSDIAQQTITLLDELGAVDPSKVVKFNSDAQSLVKASSETLARAEALRKLGVNSGIVDDLVAQANSLKLAGQLKAADSFTKKLDTAGNTIGGLNVVYSVYQDIEKYGTSSGEMFSTSMLGLLDSVDIVLNKGNPFAALGLAPAIMDLSSGGSVYEASKNFMSGVSDPLGTLVDGTRLYREVLWTTSEADESALNAVDQIQKFSHSLSKTVYGFGENSSKNIVQSNSEADFLFQIKKATDIKLKGISSGINSIDQYIVDLNAVKNDIPWFLPGKDVRISTYESLINTLQMERATLVKLQNKLLSSDSVNQSASIYGEAWITYNNIKSLKPALENYQLNLNSMVSSALLEKQKIDTNLSTPMLNNISGLNQGANSHIGSANIFAGWNFNSAPELVAVTDKTNLNNNPQQTGLQQTAQATNTVAFKSSDWSVVSGDPAKHYGIGNSFGDVTAPNGGAIAALNNAGVQETVMQKTVTIPTGVKQVTVGMMANFVTNEYPTYVGSQYNDKSVIEIKTGSGNVYQATLFNKELNSANFQTVGNLPSPMMSTGGQTGFESVNKTIPVANGGQLTITVKTTNVGDTAYPSATLINNTSVK